MLTHLDKNNLLCDEQHGFRHKHSGDRRLFLFVDDLVNSMSKGKQTDAVVMDFSKAFDVVPHGSLLSKLSYYGVRGPVLKWIDNFLLGRTQRVMVEGELSDIAPVTSGVPQGSVLGPILFLVFINDMPDCIQSKARLFADDTIVYRTIEGEKDSRQLQDDLKALEEWEKTWGMAFNPSKCETITVSRKRSPHITPYFLKNEELGTTNTANYLGVAIASNLSWSSHIARTAAKGNRALGFIRRNIRTSCIRAKEKAYKALVRPTLEYASTVWSPGQRTLSDTIERVQRRAARYVCHKFQRTASVSAMLESLNWDKLEERRHRNRASMLFKIVHSLVAVPKSHLHPTSRETRGNSTKFHQLHTTQAYHTNTFFPSAIKIWNSLPSSISTITDLDKFKEHLNSISISKLLANPYSRTSKA